MWRHISNETRWKHGTSLQTRQDKKCQRNFCFFLSLRVHKRRWSEWEGRIERANNKRVIRMKTSWRRRWQIRNLVASIPSYLLVFFNAESIEQSADVVVDSEWIDRFCRAPNVVPIIKLCTYAHTQKSDTKLSKTMATVHRSICASNRMTERAENVAENNNDSEQTDWTYRERSRLYSTRVRN